MNITQQREIYRLRSILHAISDGSFQYNRINKLMPLETATSETAESLIEAYREIVQRVSTAIASYEEGRP